MNCGLAKPSLFIMFHWQDKPFVRGMGISVEMKPNLQPVLMSQRRCPAYLAVCGAQFPIRHSSNIDRMFPDKERRFYFILFYSFFFTVTGTAMSCKVSRRSDFHVRDRINPSFR